MGSYFKEIFQPALGGLVRGITLDDTVAKIRNQEPGTPYDNTTTQVLTYSYPIRERSSLYYSIYYGYDEQQRIRKISLSLEFTPQAENPGTFKTFEKLLDDVHTYLTNRFGNAITEITKTKSAGDEIYHTWRPTGIEPPMHVLEVLYANPKYGVRKAIRVDFSKL